MTSIFRKQSLLLFCFLGICQITLGDEGSNSVNLNYLRTPEAAAFMKYGEESVNEYTGTADISVPLYTIKCKDLEIPLVLRYDASGIKVEQEASWVGLGWNLMVGGCINYVCAGDKDLYNQSNISNQTWMEYLTKICSPSYPGIQYYHYPTDNIDTWMETVNHSFAFETPYSDNLSQDMQNYLMWGYGERDFYSVNVLGKSFKFFIDPATLNPYIIGKAGEGFKIEPNYNSDEQTGIGHQPDISEWTITDSDGYIYYFKNGDTTSEGKGLTYTFCWYLTGIKTPSGETAQLSYTQKKEWDRSRMTESYSRFDRNVSNSDLIYGTQGYSKNLRSGYVNNSYVNEIRTNNQTITFALSDSYECSGKKLDEIIVRSYNNTLLRKFNFSYSTFENSNVGGNYAPSSNTSAELRLKLINIKEISVSDTLITSFCYNENISLPSKKSCAQDYWGYYNGQNNESTNIADGQNGHTMLPVPSRFMTHNSQYISLFGNLQGANRNSNGDYVQAAILKKVEYPTGGYTFYEYEPNSISTTDYTQSLEYEEYLKRPYDINITKYFSYTADTYINTSNDPYYFTLTDSLAFSLCVRCSGDAMNVDSISIAIISSFSDEIPVYLSIPYRESDNYDFIFQGKLPAGNYFLTIGAASYGTNNYSIGCNMRGNYTTSLSFHDLYPQNTFSRIAGGVRVKKISNYNEDNQLVNYTTYDYNTSGILLNSIETIEPYSYTYLKAEEGGFETRYIYSTHPIYGCTITTGKSRFPAFYASCNPGIVGYSKVTKRKYDANGSLDKTIVTTYTNHKPEVSMMNMDFYKCLDNGDILSQKTLNADGIVTMEIQNEYRTHVLEDDEEKDRWYSTNMVALDNLRIDPEIQGFNPTDPIFNTRFYVWKYPYIHSRVDLIKTTTTEYCSDGSTIISEKEYRYNNKKENLQVAQIDQTTSLTDLVQRTKFTYSSDETDVASRSLTDRHMLNVVVKKEEFLIGTGSVRLNTQATGYTSHYRDNDLYYLPSSQSLSIGNSLPETRTTYLYDDSLNVCSISVDSIETVYLWSYSGQYPIAKIEGLTYYDVQSKLGTATISALISQSEPSRQVLSSIRNAINSAGGSVTTYTFKPLVGITSETLPDGVTISYEYDSFGRLKSATDMHGNIVSSYKYHYK